ncbi:hypothetical protein OTU49_017498, partial [Cherax quadricarinatus]
LQTTVWCRTGSQWPLFSCFFGRFWRLFGRGRWRRHPKISLEKPQAADTKNTMPKDGQVRRKKTQSKDEGSVADSTGHIYIMDLRPAKIAQRSRIIRMSERGFSPMDIARRLGISRHTVYTWLNRWEEDRNLYDRARSGAPKKTSAEQDESIKEAAVTNPSTNAMKIREKLNLKVTPRTVRNRLHAAGIQPTLVVKERLKGKTRLQSSEH